MMGKTSVYIIQAKKYGVHRHWDGTIEVVPVGIDEKVVAVYRNKKDALSFLKKAQSGNECPFVMSKQEIEG